MNSKIFAGLVLLVATAAVAQETSAEPREVVVPFAPPKDESTKAEPEFRRRPNRLTISPAFALFGIVGAEYDRAVADDLSIYVGPQAIFSGALMSMESYRAYGFDVSTGLRYFPLSASFPVAQRAPRGWWVAGQGSLGYADFKSTLRHTEQEVWSGTLTALSGYSVITDGGFTASFGGGAGVGIGGWSYWPGLLGAFDRATLDTWDTVHLRLVMHVNLGWAF
jgi:hypothetical protein